MPKKSKNNSSIFSIVGIIILLFTIIVCYLKIKSMNEYFIILEKQRHKKKNTTKTIKIPLKIWQTHESNDLPESSYNKINHLIKNNPEFEYTFFTNKDRIDYMESNFNKEVVNAYKKINSGAGKSDIWRLAILLKKGGIYIDSDFKLDDNYKPFIDIIDEDDEFIHGRGWHVWGFDAPYPNGVLCSTPNHPVIKYAFNSVIHSINNKKPLKNIGKHKGWTELECYTGTPHLWKAIIKYTGDTNLKEGKYKYGITICNKIMNNLYHDYSNDLTELSTGGGHWMNQKTFNDKENDENYNSFPKNIYMCNKTKNIPSFVINNWKKLNPDYNIIIYDDNDCINFLKKEYDQRYVDLFNKIKDGPIKADFWRICILYKYGGVYSDLDIKPIVPISKFLKKNINFLTCISNCKTGLNPHFIISKANEELLLKCIETYLQKMDSNYDYWKWSICPNMKDNYIKLYGNIPQKDGIYKNNQLLLEILNEKYDQYKCIYDNETILYNRYDNYIINTGTFKEKNNNITYNSYENTIIQTYFDKSKIPDYIYENIKKYAPNYKHIIYDDKECISFLQKNFDKNVVDRFNSLKSGAHKADLFRYCYLYINGGLYLDIKTVLIKNISEIFKNKKYIYSVFSISKGTVYQGIIYTPPKEKLFKILIDKFLGTTQKELEDYYLIFTKQFYDTVCELTAQSKIKRGLNGEHYYFFQEKSLNESHCNYKKDRYGYCVFVLDKDDNKIIKIRHESFPW